MGGNMPTDTSEKGLETRTVHLLQESGWLPGNNQDYYATFCLDLVHLAAFLHDTQPETAQALHLDSDDTTRRQFLQRLHRQIRDRGIIDVLRNGIDHGPHSIRLFYGTPSPVNQQAACQWRRHVGPLGRSKTVPPSVFMSSEKVRAKPESTEGVGIEGVIRG